jgi:DNA-binding MarR family transcriptional regulator
VGKSEQTYGAAQEGLLIYLLNRERVGKDSRIEWSVAVFLGRQPTPTDSANVSRLLKSLVKRQVIELHNTRASEGKRWRTTHISLTDKGRRHARALAAGYRVVTERGAKISIRARELNASYFTKYLLARELNAVDAALANDLEDYTPYGFRKVEPGTICKTKSEVQFYRIIVKAALEVAEENAAELWEETAQKIKGIKDMFPPATLTDLTGKG